MIFVVTLVAFVTVAGVIVVAAAAAAVEVAVAAAAAAAAAVAVAVVKKSLSNWIYTKVKESAASDNKVCSN